MSFESNEDRRARELREIEMMMEQARWRAFMQKMNEQRSSNSTSSSTGGAAGGGSIQNPPSPGGPNLQSALIVFKETEQSNFTYYVANYSTETILGPFDTGVSVDDYSIDNLDTHTIQYGGYGLKFYRGDINEHTMLFITSDGTIVETFTGISTDIEMSSRDGRYIVATDFDEGLLWVFDGTNLLNQNTSVLTGVGSFSTSTSNSAAYVNGVSVSTSTTVDSDTIRKFWNCNATGVTKIYEETQSPANDFYPEYTYYFNMNKLVVRTFEQATSRLSKLQVISLSGVVEHTINIDTSEYTDSQFQTFGSSSFFLHLRNSSDATVNHLVWVYDGIAGNLDSVSLDAEVYVNWQFDYFDRSLSSSYDRANCDNLSAIFYTELSQMNGIRMMTQCKIIRAFAGEDLSLYEFANGETKGIYTSDIGRAKNFFLYAIYEGGSPEEISSMVIKSTGDPVITQLGHPIAGLDDIDALEVGDRANLVIEYDGEAEEINTIIHSYDSLGNKEASVLELNTNSHSTDINYDVLLVSGDGNHNFLNPTTGSWQPYDIHSNEYTALFHTTSDQSTAPYVYTEAVNEIYYFSDQGFNDIDDGGDDMYDGANEIYTNISGGRIPYTHTQLGDDPDEGVDPAEFIMDGSIESGDGYFSLGSPGSSYFTNLYPGLFVMVAKDVDINEFEIDGNIGADGGGAVDSDSKSITGIYSKNYTAYIKKVYGAGDPSINQIIIVDTDGTGIDQTVDLTSEDDLHRLTGLGSVSEIHYLLMSKAAGTPIYEDEIDDIITQYLNLVDGESIENTLTSLNTNYENITGVLPLPGSPKSARIYRGNGTVSSFNIDSYNNRFLGRNRFFVTYSDPENDDHILIRNYSLAGGLIDSFDTGQSSIDRDDNVEDRGLVITTETIDSTQVKKLCMITSSGISSIEINCPDESNTRTIFNDWGWYND